MKAKGPCSHRVPYYCTSSKVTSKSTVRIDGDPNPGPRCIFRSHFKPSAPKSPKSIDHTPRSEHANTTCSVHTENDTLFGLLPDSSLISAWLVPLTQTCRVAHTERSLVPRYSASVSEALGMRRERGPASHGKCRGGVATPPHRPMNAERPLGLCSGLTCGSCSAHSYHTL